MEIYYSKCKTKQKHKKNILNNRFHGKKISSKKKVKDKIEDKNFKK
jgi:hypothetical protein